MKFNSPTTSPSSTTLQDLHADMLMQILRLLDGSALAATASATTHLHSLSCNPDLWRDLCLSSWPSLRSHQHLIHHHQSFFADAFSSPRLSDSETAAILSPELISAVDVYHNGVPVFSRVITTDTSTPWFKGTPFRVGIANRKQFPVATPQDTAATMENFTLTWLVIDPKSGRAVELSSRKPVAVERHCVTNETVVRFATVVDEGSCVAAVVEVRCKEGTGHVLEVSMGVEGAEGLLLNGERSVEMLGKVMNGGRRRLEGEEVVRERWRAFTSRRRVRKEEAAAKDVKAEMVCAGGVVVLMVVVVGVLVWMLV